MKRPVEIATIEELHAAYCQTSGRPENLEYLRGFWARLLESPEYQGDLQRLRRDVGFVAWYLRGAIAKGVRYPGAMKLRNLLLPEKFADELAEAIQMAPKWWAQHARQHAEPKTVPLQKAGKGAAEVAAPTITEEAAQKGVAALREWRKGAMGK